MQIALIGCSKDKNTNIKRGDKALPSELYTSRLFKARVKYAESRRMAWYVISAEFGLWPSNEQKDPFVKGQIYDSKLHDLEAAERAAWHTSVAHNVVELLWVDDKPIQPKQLLVSIHAGMDYRQPLASILRSLGIRIECPCEGLGIGEQLRYYKEVLA